MKYHKIGITSNEAENRRNHLRRQYSDENIEIVYTYMCTNRDEASAKEKLLHTFFSHLHVSKYCESQDSTGINLGREWFELDTEDVRFVKSEGLFLSFYDTFIFHPYAMTHYLKNGNNNNVTDHLRKISILLSESWCRIKQSPV